MAATNNRRRRAGESETAGSDAPALAQGGVITALRPQARRPDRCSLYIDGTYVCGLPAAVVEELGWRAGQAVSGAELAAGLGAAQRGAAREDALRYLAAAPRTRREVICRLQRRGYAPEVAEATVQWLAERRLLDDVSLAQGAAAALKEGYRRLGRAAARQKLLARGLDREVVESALQATYGEGDELAAARAAATRALRRLQGLDRPVARRRLAGSLQRRGFDWETIRQVLRESLGEDE